VAEPRPDRGWRQRPWLRPQPAGGGGAAGGNGGKDWLAEAGIAARVRYYGCPAEEGGGGKTFMVQGRRLRRCRHCHLVASALDHRRSCAARRWPIAGIDFTFARPCGPCRRGARIWAAARWMRPN
jgi:hypothetical protein